MLLKSQKTKDPFGVCNNHNKVKGWMELITPMMAKVLAYYDHLVWGNYAAVTEHTFGKGLATYIGCWTDIAVEEKFLAEVVKKANLWGDAQSLYFP